MIAAAIVGIANYSIYMATIDYMICAYGPYSGKSLHALCSISIWEGSVARSVVDAADRCQDLQLPSPGFTKGRINHPLCSVPQLTIDQPPLVEGMVGRETSWLVS